LKLGTKRPELATERSAVLRGDFGEMFGSSSIDFEQLGTGDWRGRISVGAAAERRASVDDLGRVSRMPVEEVDDVE